MQKVQYVVLFIIMFIILNKNYTNSLLYCTFCKITICCYFYHNMCYLVQKLYKNNNMLLFCHNKKGRTEVLPNCNILKILISYFIKKCT